MCVLGAWFLKNLGEIKKKKINYVIHCCVHSTTKKYYIDDPSFFSFITLTWRLDHTFFSDMINNKNCVLCLDDSTQIKICEQYKIPHILCPFPVFQNLSDFKIIEHEKKYDAVLNCRNSLWKRRKFALSIEKLAVIYYPSPRSSAPDNIIFNKSYMPNIINGVYNKLTSKQVNNILNQCKVGLVLSNKEGSPRAVLEYLLCGLPVVTTKANCGRWEFLNDTNSLIVEDNEEAVKKGVDKAIEFLETGKFKSLEISENSRTKVEAFRKIAEDYVGGKLLWDK